MGAEHNDSLFTTDPSLAAELAGRWEAAARAARRSPWKGMTLSCIARYAGAQTWHRRGVSGDTLESYIYLSFEQLLGEFGMNVRQVGQLLDILETSFSLDNQFESILSVRAVQEQALEQRMRVVNDLGLFLDYPVALSNLDVGSREFCARTGISTFDTLVFYLSREASLAGSLKVLQSVLAHGDQKGLAELFPFRIGQTGFHLAEALKMCLARLTPMEHRMVEKYFESQSRRTPRHVPMPPAVDERLVPDVFKVLVYFGHKRPEIVASLDAHEFDYIRRRLMHLDDPELEEFLLWLVRFAVGILELNRKRREERSADQPYVKFDDSLIAEYEVALGKARQAP